MRTDDFILVKKLISIWISTTEAEFAANQAKEENNKLILIGIVVAIVVFVIIIIFLVVCLVYRRKKGKKSLCCCCSCCATSSTTTRRDKKPAKKDGGVLLKSPSGMKQRVTKDDIKYGNVRYEDENLNETYDSQMENRKLKVRDTDSILL